MRGEIYGVLGANGSGKSTLIRLISTLLLPDAGSVEVFGLDVVRDAAQVRRLINRVSVEASLFKKLSAMENLTYAAGLYSVDTRAARKDVIRILGALGISETRIRQPVEKMSRGMQQKVSIARALLTSPVLLLLDEPTTGLDPRSKKDVQQFVLDLRETHDATVLLTSHDMEEADALCDRLAIVDKGRIVVEGTPHELKEEHIATARARRSAVSGRRVHGSDRTESGRRRFDDDEEDEDRMAANAPVWREVKASYAFVERNVNLSKRYWGWEITFLLYTIAQSASVIYIADAAPGAVAKAHRPASVRAVPGDRRAHLVVHGEHVHGHRRERAVGALGRHHRVHHDGADHRLHLHPGVVPLRRDVRPGAHVPGVGRPHLALPSGRQPGRTVCPLCAIVALGSVSFIGIGIMAATLPLLFTEKGAQMTYVIEACLLLISGVYFPISVLPAWMQPLSHLSPATYVLSGIRDVLLRHPTGTIMLHTLVPLAVIGMLTVPLGFWVFSWAEHYAKRTGRLKRTG